MADIATPPPRLPSAAVDLPDAVDPAVGLATVAAALADSPFAVMLTDPDLDPPGPRVIYFNKAGEAMTGYTAAELIGRSPRLFQCPATDRRELDRLRAALADGRIYSGELVNLTRAGHEYRVRLTVTPVRHRGRTVAFLSYQSRVDDPAARQRAEVRLRTVLGFVSDAVVVVDPAGNQLFVSESTRRLFGYDPDALVGRSMFEHIHPDDRAEVHRRFLDLLARPGGSLAAEFRYFAADGRLVDLDVAAVNLLDHPDVGGVLVAARDATARRRAEQELRESSERFRGLFDNAAVGMAVLDGLRIRAVNPAVTAMLGYTPDELVGQECMAVTHPDDHAAELPALREVLAGVRHHVWLSKRYIRKDGSVCFADLWFQAVRYGGPHPESVAVIIDRTEQRKVEAQFRQSQKMEALGQLAGGVAHDFNNLLTIIVGNLEMIRLPEGDPNRVLVEAVAAAAARAGTLTRKLLGFARRQPVTAKPVDLAQVVADTASVLSRTIDPRVRVETAVAPRLPQVTADPGAVQQALLNLCLNARDAMPAGGTLTISAEVTAVSDKKGRFVRLSVTDTGTGMTPEIKARVFEPFFTTKPEGQGTGLGLPMVDQTARQFGGWVECESAVGVGTRFDLYLPATEPNGAGPVLVMDDDDTVRAVAVAVLESAGYSVSEAADAAAGLARAAESRPAVIVLDLNLPDRRGAELLAAVRAGAPGVPLVLLSGDVLPGDELPAGVTAAVPKPFARDELLSAVRSATRPVNGQTG